MEHIVEPKGVDFFIQSTPLTNNERRKISEFIKNLNPKEQKENEKRIKKLYK